MGRSRTHGGAIGWSGLAARVGDGAEEWRVVGVPDELERLWTPHRMAYISGDTRPTAGDDSPEACPFCQAPSLSAQDGLVVARGERVYAVLNRFPYNAGHLLICPYRHIADYPDLDDEETVELARFTQAAMRAVRTVSGATGFNVGMNQGGVAGAGISAHLHQHVVPRWAGDTNFMPVIGRTRTLPQLLGDTRALLAAAWPADRPARKRAGGRAQPAPAAGAVAAGGRQPVGRAPAATAKRTRRAAGASTVETPAPSRAMSSRRRSGSATS